MEGSQDRCSSDLVSLCVCTSLADMLNNYRATCHSSVTGFPGGAQNGYGTLQVAKEAWAHHLAVQRADAEASRQAEATRRAEVSRQAEATRRAEASRQAEVTRRGKAEAWWVVAQGVLPGVYKGRYVLQLPASSPAHCQS